MKACLTLCFAALFSWSLSAQKQLDGSFITELNFTPFGDDPLSVNGLKFRYFPEETFCVRAQLNLATTRLETVLLQPGDTMVNTTSNPDPVLRKTSTFDFSFAPGVEFHSEGSDRLSAYGGAFILLGTGNEEEDIETWGPIDEANLDNPANWQNWSTIHTTPFSSFGIGLVTGADFYFADNIYLGAEIALAFQRTNYKDTEITFSNLRGYQLAINPADPGSVDSPQPLVNGSESQFGPSVNGAIRLGYIINGR